MKKIVKLTEKELTNMIKKIISEQTTNKTGGSTTNKTGTQVTKKSQAKYEKLPKTIKIRAGGEFFVELNEVTKNNNYCVFRGQIRGRTPNSAKAKYDCNNQWKPSILLAENGRPVGGTLTQRISPKANDLLKTACDCGGYVMNKSSEPSNMV